MRIRNQLFQDTICANFHAKRTTLNFFSLNLGKLPNTVQYLGSCSVKSVAESWAEAEMRWVKMVGGRMR